MLIFILVFIASIALFFLLNVIAFSRNRYIEKFSIKDCWQYFKNEVKNNFRY